MCVFATARETRLQLARCSSKANADAHQFCTCACEDRGLRHTSLMRELHPAPRTEVLPQNDALLSRFYAPALLAAVVANCAGNVRSKQPPAVNAMPSTCLYITPYCRSDVPNALRNVQVFLRPTRVTQYFTPHIAAAAAAACASGWRPQQRETPDFCNFLLMGV